MCIKSLNAQFPMPALTLYHPTPTADLDPAVIPTEPEEVVFLSPAQVAACQQLQVAYASLAAWAEQSASLLRVRVVAGTATSAEYALWADWQRAIAETAP